MKYYKMVEPGEKDIPVWSYLSEQEIIEEFGNYICLMYLSRLGYLPTIEQIIEEWCIVHWAVEVK